MVPRCRCLQTHLREGGSPGGRRILAIVPGLVAAAMSLIVFAPVTNSQFLMDELRHFYSFVNYGVAELLTNPHGGHLLYFSNLAYLFGYELFGYHAYFFNVVALLTHAANVLLFQRVADHFTGCPVAAGIAAMLWGCSVVDVDSISWFAVYGHLLVATCLLWILGEAARASRDGTPISGIAQLRWYLLLLAAAGSFGFGLGLAGSFFLASWLLVPGVPNRGQILRRFATLLLVLPGLYLLVHFLHAHLSGRPAIYGVGWAMQRGGLPPPAEWLGAFSAFSNLVSYGVSSVFLGSLVYLRNQGALLGPFQGRPFGDTIAICQAVAAIWAIAFAIACSRADREARCQALSLVLLALACYGTLTLWMIPSGRLHDVTIGSLHIPKLWHSIAGRYHYVAPLLILMATVRLLPGFLRQGALVRGLVSGIAVAWAVASAVLSGSVVRHVALAGRPDFVQRTVDWVLPQVRACPTGGNCFLENQAVGLKGTHLPGRAGLFMIAFPDNRVEGRRVYFIETDRELLESVREQPNTRIADLLVSPGEAVALERQQQGGAGAAGRAH